MRIPLEMSLTLPSVRGYHPPVRRRRDGLLAVLHFRRGHNDVVRELLDAATFRAKFYCRPVRGKVLAQDRLSVTLTDHPRIDLRPLRPVLSADTSAMKTYEGN